MGLARSIDKVIEAVWLVLETLLISAHWVVSTAFVKRLQFNLTLVMFRGLLLGCHGSKVGTFLTITDLVHLLLDAIRRSGQVAADVQLVLSDSTIVAIRSVAKGISMVILLGI